MTIVQNYIQSAKVLKIFEIKEGKSKIIRYFCIVKRFNYILRGILAVLLINLTTTASAQFLSASEPESDASQPKVSTTDEAWLDSVDISLLTCGPGHEVWSLYGHTALRIDDKAHGVDVAVNWGMFSFHQDYFILRFVFGLTDYQMGICPMNDFLAEYASEGRWVKQQRIRLSRGEKLKIMRAIELNDRPDNRTYRYNFFYDNCTTRARDMILNNIGHDHIRLGNANTHSSYRNEIHKLNENDKWARFGNDLLLGYQADQDLTQQEWEFLPDNLRKDFDVAERTDTEVDSTLLATNPQAQQSGYISLVDTTFYLIPPQSQATDASEASMPRTIAIVLFVVIAALSLWEYAKKKNFWWLDTVLLTLTGLPGIILAVMIFSQHPTVQVNFQILILNPLNLIFVWQVSKKLRKHKMHWYFQVWGWLLIAALLLQYKQDYADGMVILALSLLLRYFVRMIEKTIKPISK